MKSKHLPKSKNSKYSASSSYMSSQTHNKLYILPLILIMSVLPLIMYLHEFDSGLSGFSWYPDSNEQLDIFLYCKQIFFITVCCIMLLLTSWKVFIEKKTVKFFPIFIPYFFMGS